MSTIRTELDLTGDTRSGQPDSAITRDAADGTRRPFDLRSVALPVVLTVILAVLQLWGNIGHGYLSGWGDHFVLSPEGLSWANPGAFENDWFMELAPQPHWFFDLVTFAGASLGILSLAYALFWLAGLVAFAVATTLLAYRFFPTAAWPVALAVTGIAAITPWMIGGTGSGMITQALPAVLSANLIYLLIAGLLTEHRVLVVVLAPLIAVVHVQQGSIVLVLVVSMLIVEGVRERRIDWYLVGAGAFTAAVVAFGLVLRPVASNLQDFVRICDEVIPYHCAAHLWSKYELFSTAGLIGLAIVGALLIPKSHRWIWCVTVGLVTLGYTGGFLSDLLRIPVLGTLAQGVNVYRLGAVLVPFAVWGVLAPLLVRLRGWRQTALIVVWASSWVGFLLAPGFPSLIVPRLALMILALGVPVAWFVVRTARQPPVVVAAASGTAALSAALLVLVASGLTGAIGVREPNFTFIGDAGLREWGAEVRDIVPQGDVLLASPRFEWVKLITQRAVIADCKDVPYGGDAWQEWQRRLDLLGGYKQCVAPGPLLFDDLTADELIDVADEFESDFIVVNPLQPDTVLALEERGWTRALSPIGTSGAELLQRPE